MDAIAGPLGLDRAEVRLRNFITPDEMPYDHQLIFQDGRPLIYDSGDFPASLRQAQGRWSAGTTVAGRRARRPGRTGAGSASGSACYVEGTGVGPYEGAHVLVESTGQGQGRDRADHAGPGPLDDVRADRRRRARRAVRGRRGDHRRHPAVRLRGRHLRLAGRGDERQRGRAGGAQGAGEGAADRRRRAGGRPRRPGDRRRRGAGQGVARRRRSRWPRSRCCPTRCATRSTRRPRRRPSSPSGDPRGRRCADGEEPGLEGTDYYSPIQARPSPTACTR